MATATELPRHTHVEAADESRVNVAATGTWAAHLRVGVVTTPTHTSTPVEGAQTPGLAPSGNPTDTDKAKAGVGSLLACQDAYRPVAY